MELLILPAATILAAALLFLLLRRLNSPKLRLPPGPRGLPIFGYLLRMAVLMKRPMNLQKLVKDYGPIITIHLGSIPLIIISSPAIVQEALIEKGSLFSSRPKAMTEPQLLLSNQGRSISAAVYGNHWRTVRRSLVSCALTPVRVHEFQSVRDHAVSSLVDKLRRNHAACRAAVPVLTTIRLTIFAILARMCFGLWLEEATVENMDGMLRGLISIAGGNVTDFVPWLKIFQLGSSVDVMLHQIKSKMDQILLPLIQQSRLLHQQGTLDPNSYVASLLQLQQQDRQLNLTDDDMVVLCSEFLNAGADTTANTLEWSLANLIKLPDLQQKLFQEIHCEVGNNSVAESDLEKLTLLQAVVKETLRKHPPGYTTLPHAVTQPGCKLGGYDIPMNATLLFNIYAINNDPHLWLDPDEFRPERFVGKNAVQADYASPTSGRLVLIPFGAGRRICPGLNLATLHLHYILARLLQEFEWSASGEADEAVDLTPTQEITVVMKKPLRATVRARAE